MHGSGSVDRGMIPRGGGMTTIYYEKDGDLGALDGQKVAVVG